MDDIQDSKHTFASASFADRPAIRRQVLRMIWRTRVGDAKQRASVIHVLEKTHDPVWYEEWTSQGGWVAIAWVARIWRLACEQAATKSLPGIEDPATLKTLGRIRMRIWRPFRPAVVESLSETCGDSSIRAAHLLLHHAPHIVQRSTPHLLEFARQAPLASVLLQNWARLSLAESDTGLSQSRAVTQASVSDPGTPMMAKHGVQEKATDEEVFDALRATLEGILQTDSSSMRRIPLFPDDTDGLLALPAETPQQEYARLLASACVRHADTRAIALLLEQLDRKRNVQESMQALAILAEWRQNDRFERKLVDPPEQETRIQGIDKARKASQPVQAADILRMEIAKRIADRFSADMAHRFPVWIRILCQWRCAADQTLLQACAIRALENACEESTGAARARLDTEVYMLAPDHTMARATAPLVDVVFLHGLRGDPLLTWRCGAFDPRKLSEDDQVEAPVQAATIRKNMDIWREHLWPRTWLASDLDGRARILSVGYSSALTSWGGSESPTASLSLSEQAADLREKLLKAGVGKRPLILIAHSYGGLIAKQLLVDDASAPATMPRSTGSGVLTRALRGIVFYSTPHHGSAVAGKLLGGILDKAVRPATPVRELLPYNESIEKLHSAFLALVRHPCRQLGDARERNRLPGMLWGLWLTAVTGQSDHRESLTPMDTSRPRSDWASSRLGSGSFSHGTTSKEREHRQQDRCEGPTRRQLLRERGDQIMDALGPVSVGPEFVHGLLRDYENDHGHPVNGEWIATNTPTTMRLQVECALPPVRVLSICEGVPTKTWGGSRFLFVSEESAYAGVGQLVRVDHADHLQVCKPPSPDDVRYRSVLGMIQAVAQETTIWCRECSGSSD